MSQPKKPAPKPAGAPKPATKKPAPPVKGGAPAGGGATGRPAAKPTTQPAAKSPQKGGGAHKSAAQKGGAAQKHGAQKSGQRQAQRKAPPSPAPSEGGSRLVAIVDGAALGEAEARALWGEFSSYLEEHELDFAGFAASKGWKSIKPEHRAGRAVLLVESG